MDVQMRPIFQNKALLDTNLPNPSPSPPPPHPNLQLRKPDLIKFYNTHKAFPKQHLLSIMCELLDIGAENAQQYEGFVELGEHYSAKGKHKHRVYSALGHYSPVFAEVPGAYNAVEGFMKERMDGKQEILLFNFAKVIFKYVFSSWYSMFPLANYPLISSILSLLKSHSTQFPIPTLQSLLNNFFLFFTPHQLSCIIVDCIMTQHPKYMQHLIMNILKMYGRENKETIEKVWKGRRFEFKIAELLRETRKSLKGRENKGEKQEGPSLEECLEYEIKCAGGLRKMAIQKQENYQVQKRNEQIEEEMGRQREKMKEVIKGIKIDRENYCRTVDAMNKRVKERVDNDYVADLQAAKEEAWQIERVKAMIQAVSIQPSKPVIHIPKQRLKPVKYDLHDLQQTAAVSLTLQKHISQHLQPVILSINQAHQSHPTPHAPPPNPSSSQSQSQSSPLQQQLLSLINLKDKLEHQKLSLLKSKLTQNFTQKLHQETISARDKQRRIIEKEGAKVNKQFRRLVEEVAVNGKRERRRGKYEEEDLYIDKEIERMEAEVERKKKMLQRLK